MMDEYINTATERKRKSVLCKREKKGGRKREREREEERERERGGDRERESERGKERESEKEREKKISIIFVYYRTDILNRI